MEQQFEGNRYIIEKEIRQVEIQRIEEELTAINKKVRDQEVETITEEQRALNLEEKEKIRKSYIPYFFKEFANREMTDQEYKDYTKKLDDPETKKGWNIKDFIEEINPEVLFEKQEKVAVNGSNEQIQELTTCAEQDGEEYANEYVNNCGGMKDER